MKYNPYPPATTTTGLLSCVELTIKSFYVESKLWIIASLSNSTLDPY